MSPGRDYVAMEGLVRQLIALFHYNLMLSELDLVKYMQGDLFLCVNTGISFGRLLGPTSCFSAVADNADFGTLSAFTISRRLQITQIY